MLGIEVSSIRVRIKDSLGIRTSLIQPRLPESYEGCRHANARHELEVQIHSLRTSLIEKEAKKRHHVRISRGNSLDVAS